MKSLFRTAAILLASCLALTAQDSADLEAPFKTPPDEARPWVFWFWINGNISREDITKNLQAIMHTLQP